MIEVRELRKEYPGDVVSLDGISLDVADGEIYGFLGPNGAGKSTTVKILTTLTLPTGGVGRVAGFDVVQDPASVRYASGVVLQDVGIDPLLSGRELLVIQARLYGASDREGKKRAAELLDLVDLESDADRRVGTYSGGMRRRLDLALALVHEPRVLFLDEPTTGLDPASRRTIWEEVRRLNREAGVTVFLTTQYLEEADQLAGRIGIINNGTIVAEGRPDDLKSEFGDESILLDFTDMADTHRARSVLTSISTQIQEDGTALRIYVTTAATEVAPVVEALQHAGLRPNAVTLSRPTLDDVFLAVTGERFRTQEATEQTSESAVA